MAQASKSLGSDAGQHGRNYTSDRTLQILGMFNDDRLRITPQQVAAELGMSRSTSYRYLQSLVREQFLESAADGSLRLGMRAFDLARLARQGLGISELARPIMRQLARAHRQPVLLTVLSGRSVVCLEREDDPDQFTRLSYEPGSELPPNAGASALVLLAWKPREEAKRLLSGAVLRFTENTLTDVDEILTRLDAVRTAGECLSYAEVDRDAVGIAVPVFAGTEVVAALSIVAQWPAFRDAQVAEALADLRAGAGRLGRRLSAMRVAEG